MAKQDNNRMRTALPVSGLDTATPDHSVADGKCEELHNLRWQTGGWHQIDPLEIRHRIAPTPGREEFFADLEIVYHHPAAGDETYIASHPNADGTIDLFQVSVAEGLLAVKNRINPILFRVNHTTNGFRVILHSWELVASDVRVAFKFIKNGVETSATLTIPAGKSGSNPATLLNASFLLRSEELLTSCDDSYQYRIYTNETSFNLYDGAFASDLPSDIRISHFGNILLITDPTTKSVGYYYLRGDSYSAFEIPAPPRITQTPLLADADSIIEPEPRTRIQEIDLTKVDNLDLYKFYDPQSGLFHFDQIKGQYFWGEICYFAIFQLYDGSFVAPSALAISSSEPFSYQKEHITYTNKRLGTAEGFEKFSLRKSNFYKGLEIYLEKGEKFIPENHQAGAPVFGIRIRPYITLTIPSDLDSDLIRAVNIYSTRINPLWDTQKLNLISGSSMSIRTLFRNYRADNRLPEQPFYFFKSIRLSQFTDGVYNMYIDANELENIEQNATYEPVDAHSMYVDTFKEYNNRLNTAGGSGLRLFEGYQISENGLNLGTFLTSINIDGEVYVVGKPSTASEPDLSAPCCNRILSYPDYRATNMYDHTDQTVELEKATANNFAYACALNEFDDLLNGGDYIKYSIRFKPTTKRTPPATGNFIPNGNKLRVSAPNNPFSFPLANSYAVGTERNRILAVNSAAIEMSDAKFGEFPLYLFTEEGIFTLQSGSGEVLYAATIPLNYDRIVNPRTLAVNHNILYITERGVHAMFSNQSKLISEPLNDLHGTPPLDYLRTASMCYQSAHNEIIVWNRTQAADRAAAGERAFVYSLDGGYWSTRDFEGIKLNTDELFVRTSATEMLLTDLTREAPQPGRPIPIRLVSRPIRFGSTEFKRLETLVARLRASARQQLRLRLEGSDNLREWAELRDTGYFAAEDDVLLRRLRRSARYLRLTFEGEIDADFTLTQFDAEYYLRFVHRLR